MSAEPGPVRQRTYTLDPTTQGPLYPPSDSRAVTQNRRVEVVIMSSLPADERALLPSIAKAQ